MNKWIGVASLLGAWLGWLVGWLVGWMVGWLGWSAQFSTFFSSFSPGWAAWRLDFLHFCLWLAASQPTKLLLASFATRLLIVQGKPILQLPKSLMQRQNNLSATKEQIHQSGFSLEFEALMRNKPRLPPLQSSLKVPPAEMAMLPNQTYLMCFQPHWQEAHHP